MSLKPLLVSIAVGTICTSSVFAHPDDPKIKDRQLAVKADAFRLDRHIGSTRAIGGFESENVVLHSWLPLSELGNPDSGNDCWGYVSPSGREYALMGTSSGTAIVEVTNPGDAQVIDILNGPNSLWRDIKTYGTYMYCVSEGGGGIQVFNLAGIDQGTIQTLNSAGSGATHNVAIDTESGYLYRTGGTANGMYIYDLSNPAAPTQVGQWTDRYIHDVQVVTYTDGPFANRELAFCCAGFSGGWSDTGLTIVDVTNKSNPFVVSQTYYSNAEYCHQGWLSEDRQFFYINDELDEQSGGGPTTTRVIDVSDINNPTFVGTFTSGSSSVDHNLYTHNGMIFEANYRSGLRVFDASDPLNPTEYAYFDTYPNDDNASFNGLWSSYPYFPSGTVIGSDLERGLFVWRLGIIDPCDVPLGSCVNDIDGNGTVGVSDILAVIENWGMSGDGTFRPTGDVDDSCSVDVSDLLQLVGAWGNECIVTGSCCLSDFSCVELTSNNCSNQGGTYYGDETVCSDTACPGAGDEAATAMIAHTGKNVYETTSATPSSPEPDDSQCSGTYMNWSNSQDVWFIWTADFSGSAHFTTCESSSFDTSMALYAGSESNQVTCNGDGDGDNGCQSYYSAFDYSVQQGEIFYIRIGGWEGATGTGILTIE